MARQGPSRQEVRSLDISVREYRKVDLDAMRAIWNDIVEAGVYFPQVEPLSESESEAFFAQQTYAGVADDGGEVVGLYILHPNNVGRCGHIANASYAVKSGQRGKHVGERLVRDSIAKGAEFSFRILQFNAVVATNANAIHLYEKIGFSRLGVIKEGFRLPDGTYAEIIPFYISLA